MWGGDSADESLKGLLAEGVHFLKRGMERATGAEDQVDGPEDIGMCGLFAGAAPI